MNVITDPLRQLMQRKLWPVALLLVAALVAVPLLLTKDPEPAPVGPVVKVSKDEGLPATFVSAPEATVESRRRVLGAEKDPFTPAELPKAKKSKKASDEDAAEATPTVEPTQSSSGDSSGGASAPPASPVPTPAGTTYAKHSIKVRFGQVDESELAATTVSRLSVLPSEDQPLLVYRGVEDGGKVAVFELTGMTLAEGDGTCKPTPEDCQVLRLRAGETEFLTITDEGSEAVQYQLDLVKIYAKATFVKDEATTAAPLKKARRRSSL